MATIVAQEDGISVTIDLTVTSLSSVSPPSPPSGKMKRKSSRLWASSKKKKSNKSEKKEKDTKKKEIESTSSTATKKSKKKADGKKERTEVKTKKGGGVGYGGGVGAEAAKEMQKKLAEINEMDRQIASLLRTLSAFLPSPHFPPFHLDETFVAVVTSSCLIPFLVTWLRNDSFLDLSARSEVYIEILGVLRKLAGTSYLIGVLDSPYREKVVFDLLENLNIQAGIFAKQVDPHASLSFLQLSFILILLL